MNKHKDAKLTAIFSATRSQFVLPADMIYLDGNSLGPLTKASQARLYDEIENQWSKKLISGWNESGWYTLPTKVGDRIAKLIGAAEGTVMSADSTSVNVYKTLSAALLLNSDRKVILSDSGNFPTDLYVAQGLIKALKQGHILKIVAPEKIHDEIDEDVAVLMLTHVDYCTGRLHNMAELTEKAHSVGAVTLWDLCHSAGALPIDLKACNADFAVGCGYKYLNGGPGAPAFLYVRSDLVDKITPALSGWMGHESPFAFDHEFKPAEGVGRLRVGTPAVLSLACLDAALNVWDGINMQDVRARSIELSELFIREVESSCPSLRLCSPRNPENRGSQVSFCFDEAYACIQALIAHGVMGDFRMPNIMRFGFTPLYLHHDDVLQAAEVLCKIIHDRLWDTAEFKLRKSVT